MSRIIEIDEKNQTNVVTLDNPKECANMYNEVCCCSDSECVTDYPDEDDCKVCKYFKKETMKPGERKVTGIYKSLFE